MRKVVKIKYEIVSALLTSKRYAKGVISLFLALIVTPLLGITCLLVESIRYQDVIEGMIEYEDLISFATLAHYDPFIKDRFGLLATSQDKDLIETYNKYFATNTSPFSKEITVTSSTAEGEFALSEYEIFKQRVEEFSEVCGFVELVCDGLNVADFMSKLNKAMDLEDMDKQMKKVQKGADIADSVTKLIDAIKKVKDVKADYEKALKEYEEAYTAFETDLKAYTKALRDSSATGEDLYKDENVDKAWKTLANNPSIFEKCSLNNYKAKVSAMSNQVTNVRKKVEDVSKKAVAVTEAIASFKKEIGAGDNNFTFIIDVANACKPLTTAVSQTDLEASSNSIVQALKGTGGLYSKLDNLKKTDFTPSYQDSNIKPTYHYDIPDDYIEVCNKLQPTLTALENLNKKETNNKSTGLMDLVTGLMEIQGIFDPKLNASSVSLYQFVDTSLSDDAAMAAMTDLISAVDDFSHIFDNILNLLKGIVKLLKAIIEFVAATILWVGTFVVNLVKLIGNYKEFWNTLLVCGYAGYNFPNRKTYKSATKLTGYDYYNTFFLTVNNGTATNVGLVDAGIKGLSSLIHEEDGCKCETFKGAEVEYLLCGTNNEIKNQCNAFFNLYMFRLSVDMAPIFLNNEVKSEASTAGQFCWVIYILIILAEPMFDAFILVNGGKEFLIKKTIYLTPSGIPALIEDLASMDSVKNLKTLGKSAENLCGGESGGGGDAGGGDEPAGAPGSDNQAGSGKPGDSAKKKGYLPCDYSQHMVILLLCRVEQKDLIMRLQNLVALESTGYYKIAADTTFDFDFNKTYTYVHSTTEYTLNPIFDFSSMTGDDFSAYTIHQERHIGY